MTHSFTIINAAIAADPSLWSAAIFRTSFREDSYPDVIRDQYNIPLDVSGVLLNENILGNLPTHLPASFLSNLASVTVDIPTTTSNDCYIAAFYQDSTGPFYFSTPLHCMNEDEALVTMPTMFDTILTCTAVLAGETLNESMVITDVTAPLYLGPGTNWAIAAEQDDTMAVVNNVPRVGFVRKFIGDSAIVFGVGNLSGPSVFTVMHNDKEQFQHSCGVNYLAEESGGSGGGTVDLTPVLDKLDAIALQITSVDTSVVSTGQTVGAKVDLVSTKVDTAKTASDDQFTGIHSHVTSLQNNMTSRFDSVNDQFDNTRQVVQDQATSIRDNDNTQFSAVQSSIGGVHSHMSDDQDELRTLLAAINGVPQNVIDMIMDLHAEAMGSWSWDKRTGILTMFDTHGLEAAKFSVTDSADLSARERRADLEAS